MALPSARRPAFIEEELEQESKKILKVKVNKVKVFMDQMEDWYKYIGQKEHDTLTLKKFKNRAIVFLQQLNFEYDKLPKNWVQTLIDKCGIVFFEKKKSAKPSFSVPDAQVLSITRDPLTVMPAKKVQVVGNDQVDHHGANNKMEESKPENRPKRPVKRFIDLTDKHPPKKWLKAFSEGQHLPRELRIYSNNDLNILYYDYDPKYKDDTWKNYEQKIHDGNSFNWWNPNYEKERASGDAPFSLNGC